MKFFGCTLAMIFFCISCGQKTFVPKPTGYYKIVLPDHTYQKFDCDGCPFSFEYPSYSKIVKDTVFFDTIPENPYWMNIIFPSLNGTIYISYKEIDARHSLAKLINDAHTLTYNHSVKADYIDEGRISKPADHVYGILYNLGGNAASSTQFFLTDSVKNFIRGALYFNNVPNADSSAPVIEFLRRDMLHLIGSFKWK